MYFGESVILNHMDFILEQNNLFCSKLDAFLKESEIDNNFDLLNEASLKEIGKNIWGVLLRIFRKLKVMFENLISNLNMFRRVKIDKMKFLDLRDCLDTLNLNNLRSHSDGNMYKLLTVPNNTNNDIESLNKKYNEYIKDLENNINSCKESPEYKKLQENKYENKDLIELPIMNINSDMKNCKTILVSYINELEKQEKNNNKIEDNIKPVFNTYISFLKKVIEYYNFRISILTIFFKHAKVDLSAAKENIKSIKNDKIDDLSYDEQKTIKQFDDFITVDTFRYNDIKSWFNSNNPSIPNDIFINVFKPKLSLMKGFGFSGSIKDKNDLKYIALVIYNEKTEKVLKSRLIAYKNINSNLEADLIENDEWLKIK